MFINLYIYVVVIFAYNIYNYIKDSPFDYITQTNYALCEKMDNTFCIRISYFVVAIILYLLTINFINLTLPQDAPKVINTITKEEKIYPTKVRASQDIMVEIKTFNRYLKSGKSYQNMTFELV